MIDYILMKATRSPGKGRATKADAYAGISCEDCAVETGKIYVDLEEVSADAICLAEACGVGINIWILGLQYPTFTTEADYVYQDKLIEQISRNR